MEKTLYEVVEKAKKYDELTFIYEDKILHCSFCGKRHKDVEKLIVGRDVFICNECVVLCNGILEDENKDNTKG